MFTYHKRITKELKEINSNIISTTIKKKFYHNNDIVEVEFDNKYPFKPPYKVYINDKLLDYKYDIDDETKNILEKYYDIKCFHCKSLMCEKNWNPTNKIIEILEENIKNIELIKKIKDFLLTCKKEKKIPEDLIDTIL